MDYLIADLKGWYVFNFLDDLVVYSSSAEEHVSTHARGFDQATESWVLLEL